MFVRPEPPAVAGWLFNNRLETIRETVTEAPTNRMCKATLVSSLTSGVSEG